MQNLQLEYHLTSIFKIFKIVLTIYDIRCNPVIDGVYTSVRDHKFLVLERATQYVFL